MRPNPLLMVFTGLPGCGKTTLARQVARSLRIPLFSKDRFQSALVQQQLAPRATAAGYLLILDQTDEQLGLGVSCIVDAVFPMAGFRQRLDEITAHHGANLMVVHCLCSDETIWRERMKDREQYHEHWTPVGWEEVERLRKVYEPWPASTPTLRIDSINNPVDNLSMILSWIDHNA